ncbi:MAG: hypothetical protein DRH08_06835 [Deltaproteobacteria bacterium]|nr:MAG: hypothetical protein DRH08_06835 [Deltaproteobacteria bacterium]
MTFNAATNYTPEQTELIRTATLTVATILGDYMDDLAVVGGLVPSLLIPPTSLPVGADPHVGTMDLDLGLDLAILDEQRYEGIAERLRESGFQPDENDNGNEVRQRWTHSTNSLVKIEFLIPPTNEDARPGRLQPLERGLAAFIISGLEVAFRDRILVELSGTTLFGELVSREIPVCNPGAFVVLKALAFRNRGKFKDAYDLNYMIRNYGNGIEDVAAFLAPLVDTDPGQLTISILREDFMDEKSIGPMRVALFATGAEDAEIQADVVGFVTELLRGAGV